MFVRRSVQSARRLYSSSAGERTPEQIVEMLRTRAASETGNLKLSPKVEEELNQEFEKAVKDFVVNPDLSKDVLRLVERTSAQRPRAVKISPSSASSRGQSGNIRGSDLFPNVRRTGGSEPYSAQELYLRQLFHQRNMTRLGASVEDVYRPHEDVFKPPTARETSISTLLAAGAHLGHSTALFRPSTQPYIYGVRDGIHIIDLDATLTHLRRAASVVEGIAEKGGLILYVGTRQGQQRSLQMAAKRSNSYYVHSRWVPGTLSNATEISSEWERMEVDMADAPTGRDLSLNLHKTIIKPDLVVVLNPVENRNAIKECTAAKIPTIGIIDTDSEPSLVSYPVPANDDSLRSTDLILGVLSNAGKKGRETRLKRFQQYKQQTEQQQSAAQFNQH
jgi:small subunit ribosomal protein S2